MKNSKRIITLLVIIFMSVAAYSQAQDQNFYLNDDKLTWQKAYTTDKSKEEIYNYFVESEIFSKAKIEGTRVIGKLTPHFVDEKKSGIPGVREIIRKTDFIANVSIEFRAKEKDYLIQLTDIKFLGRGDFLKKKETKPFESEFVRIGYNQYRPGFLKKPKQVYNDAITPIFVID